MRLVVCLGLLLLCGCQTVIVQQPDTYTPDGRTRMANEARDRIRARQGLPPSGPPSGEPALTRRTNAAPGAGVDFDLGVFSRYVWRGQLVTDDWVLQPAITVTWGDFSFGTWGNLDLTDLNDDQGEFNEIDFVAGYEHAWKAGCQTWTFSAGAIAYLFPEQFPDTLELFAGLGVDTPLNPGFAAYFDVDEIDGAYLAFDVSHRFDLGKTSLDLGAGIGWADSNYNAGYFGVQDAGFNDLRASAAMPFAFENLTVTPSVSFSYLVDDSVRAAAGTDGLVVFALMASFALPGDTSTVATTSPLVRRCGR